MRDLTKDTAALHRKIKRLAPEVAAAVKLAGELARDMEAQFAQLEARVAQLRPMASALSGRSPPPPTAPPLAVGAAAIVEQYVAARLERAASHAVLAAALYSDFTTWCAAAGHPAPGRHTFGRIMRNQDGVYRKKSSIVKYIGVRIRPDGSNGEEAKDAAHLLL
jgi:hypothetical protein